MTIVLHVQPEINHASFSSNGYKYIAVTLFPGILWGEHISCTPQTANPDPKPTPAGIAFSIARGEGRVW